MQINVRNGTLSLGSVYKLFVVGWIISWGAIFGIILLFMLIGMLITGSAIVNGEVVQGRGEALMATAPIMVLFPVVIGLQAVMFSGFLTFGVWVYRKFRSITVVNADQPLVF